MRSPELLARIGVGVALTAVIVGISFAGGMSTPTLLALLACFAVIFLPRRYILMGSLFAFAFLPVGYLRIPVLWGRYFTPAVLLLALWMIRTLIQLPKGKLLRPAGIIIVSISMLALLGIETLQSGTSRTSVTWLITISLCWALPAFVGVTRDISGIWLQICKLFAIVSILLFAVVVLEGGLKWTPWQHYYTSGGHWITFRARASLGHPLALGVASSTMAISCFVTWMMERKKLLLIGAFCATAALALTVSRGSIMATAIGALLGILLVFEKTVRRAESGGLRLFAIAVFAGVAGFILYQLPIFQTRFNSDEAVASTLYRDSVNAQALAFAQNSIWFGAGPGNAQKLLYRATGFTLENSALQLLVGAGIFGVIAVLLFFIMLALRGLRLGNLAPVAALVTFLVGISSYNALDSNPAICVLSAFLILGLCDPKNLSGFSRPPELLTASTQRRFAATK